VARLLDDGQSPRPSRLPFPQRGLGCFLRLHLSDQSRGLQLSQLELNGHHWNFADLRYHPYLGLRVQNREQCPQFCLQHLPCAPNRQVLHQYLRGVEFHHRVPR
jgi:hypothetical protein